MALAMWPSGYVAMWLCGYVAVWLCGNVAMWPCGYVAMWLCGQYLSLLGPQGAKLGATSMLNDTFWAPNELKNRRAKIT